MRSFLSDAPALRRLRSPLILCLLWNCLSVGAAAGQETKPGPRGKDLGTLRPGDARRQEMEGGDSHVWRVPLAQGQYARALIEQDGIDVVVELFEPGEAKPVVTMDSPNELRGPESVSLVARVTGDYAVRVSSGEIGVMGGSYEARIEGGRPPTEADLKRLSAESLSLEGERLRGGGTDEARRRAVDKFTEALGLWQALGDRHQEAHTLFNLGLLYRGRDGLADRLAYYRRALAVWEQAESLNGRAFTLNEIGSAYRTLDQPEKALPLYEEARKLYRAAGDQWGEARELNNIGLSYALMGQHREALDFYGQAVTLWQATRDRIMEANTYINLGGSLDRLGDPAKALAYYERAKASLQEAGNRSRLASAYNNIGLIYHGYGDVQSAIDNYTAALALHTKSAEQNPENPAYARGQANALDNLGMAYLDWGDVLTALDKFNLSLPIRRRLGEPRGLGATIDNIGFAHYQSGKYADALRYYREALGFRSQAGDTQGLAYTHMHLGSALVALKDPQQALKEFDEALQIHNKSGYKAGQAATLDRIGTAQIALGQLEQASASFAGAMSIWDALQDQQGRAMSLYGQALVESGRNNFEGALRKIGEAISAVESLRAKTTSQQLRTTYMAARQDYYEMAVDFNMRLYRRHGSEHYLAAALAASERSRARGLRDLLAESRGDVMRGADPRLVEEKKELERQFQAVSSRLLSLRGGKPTPERAPWAQREILELSKKFEALSKQHEELLARIRAKTPRYAELTAPRPFDLAELQQLLGPDTVLLEYALGERRSYFWLVTRAGVEGHELPALSEIEASVAGLRQHLTAYESPQPGESSLDYVTRLKSSATRYREQAVELGRALLGPAAGKLGKKRLVIVADGPLHLLPFEVLLLDGAAPAGTAAPARRPLGVTNEVVYLPSASTLGLLRAAPRRPAEKSVAVFADPVFNRSDERVPEAKRSQRPPSAAPDEATSGDLGRALRDLGADAGALGLARLPHSLEEAKGITSIVPGGSMMRAVGFNANRAAATSPSIGDYKIVHFATHALVDDQQPQLSGIVLSLVNEQGESQDGFLRLYEIYNLNLSAELVVLSACRTGTGKTVRGEGMVGLTRGFMYAGTSKVLASLWDVDDEATSALMKSFYKYLLRRRVPAAEALRLAKLEVMQAREQWTAPYFWAGFVLQGDWR